MRHAMLPLFLFLAAPCLAADDDPKITRVVDGKRMKFPAKGIADGMKATIGIVESCSHSDGDIYAPAVLKEAVRKDYVRIEFAKPVKMTVDRKTLQVSEFIFAEGSIWLRDGDKVTRCAKYTDEKTKPFEAWLLESTVVDCQ